MPENVSLVVAGRTAISDSRRNDSRYRLAIFGDRILETPSLVPYPISVAAWFARAASSPRESSGRDPLVRARSGRDPPEPRRGLEPSEDLARVIQQRLGVGRATR